jgi:hypothetical protein
MGRSLRSLERELEAGTGRRFETSSLPLMRDRPTRLAALISGKFCRLFGPVSASPPASLGVTECQVDAELPLPKRVRDQNCRRAMAIRGL